MNIFKRTICTVSIFAVIVFQSCKSANNSVTEVKDVESISEKESLAKFEPPNGKCILFVGQELESIGGLEDWNDGYYDHFEAPGGFTMYTNFSPGDNSFGYVLKGLDGVFTTDDWGDYPSNMSLQLADPDFKHAALAIGLSMVNHEKKVANGKHDRLIKRMGEWLKSLGRRPVFLRIGYEFGGAWNHYDRADFIKAYRRIKDRLDAMGVNNVAYVWQSHGWEEPMELLESWYPGDEYVDWCAYSFFSRWDETNMIEFARKKGKTVFIAEATPTIS
ncbi:MAG: glycoside hydrolase family 26 protein, partial [Saprospiraceae bacterium]|nr:glycoside hydrolase family 26 protein [Saprospiraceae bacterium]